MFQKGEKATAHSLANDIKASKTEKPMGGYIQLLYCLWLQSGLQIT